MAKIHGLGLAKGIHVLYCTHWVGLSNSHNTIHVHDAVSGRRGGLMVSALDSGLSGPGSRPSRGHCVVFMGKTLNSHSASFHPGV